MEQAAWDANAQLSEQMYWWSCQRSCQADKAVVIFATYFDQKIRRETAKCVQRRHQQCCTICPDYYPEPEQMRTMASRHGEEGEELVRGVENKAKWMGKRESSV